MPAVTLFASPREEVAAERNHGAAAISLPMPRQAALRLAGGLAFSEERQC